MQIVPIYFNDVLLILQQHLVPLFGDVTGLSFIPGKGNGMFSALRSLYYFFMSSARWICC